MRPDSLVRAVLGILFINVGACQLWGSDSIVFANGLIVIADYYIDRMRQ